MMPRHWPPQPPRGSWSRRGQGKTERKQERGRSRTGLIELSVRNHAMRHDVVTGKHIQSMIFRPSSCQLVCSASTTCCVSSEIVGQCSSSEPSATTPDRQQHSCQSSRGRSTRDKSAAAPRSRLKPVRSVVQCARTEDDVAECLDHARLVAQLLLDLHPLRLFLSSARDCKIVAAGKAAAVGELIDLFAETVESESRQQSAAQADRLYPH